jgi:hypothetical protein
MCYQQEDAWDRDAIVRGFWVCSGFRVESIEGEDAATSRLRIRIERRGRAIRAAGGADGLYENVSVLAAAAGSAAAES